MIKISKRLEAISSLISKNNNVIDIGCDHGLLDIYLYQNNISKKIIATDINENALNNAKENIKKYNLEKNIATRLGNGLDTITKEDKIDTIVISGMGAHTIVGILKNNQEKLKNVKELVIQSNTKLEFLRKQIIKLGYKISNENIIEENNKYYIIIKFIPGKEKYTKKELYFGPNLIKENNNIFKKYKEIELKKLYIRKSLLPHSHIIDHYRLNKEIKLYKK